MLSRRHLLQLGALSALSATPLRLAMASAAIEQRLVVFMLRGAMDGLHAVPPIGDRDYGRLRGPLALSEADGVLPLDNQFALHPSLATVKQFYDHGEAVVVHAVATPYRDRSHFDGQDLLENGSVTPHGLADGWLNRVLPLLPGGGERRLGLALGAEIPLILRGPQAVASWAPDSLPAASDDFLERVAAMYAPAPELSQALAVALDSQALASGVDKMTAGQGNQGLKRQQSAALAAVAGKMLAEPNGPRIAVMDVPGWDTHSGQGLAQGRMAQALGQLDAAIAALRENLGPVWQQTVVFTLTEFGRTAVPNGSGGTDHGTGSAAFVLGGAVAGGPVRGSWPGLGANQLYEGRDLAPTTDLRAVIMGVLASHFGLPPASLGTRVFPGAGATMPMGGLVRV